LDQLNRKRLSHATSCACNHDVFVVYVHFFVFIPFSEV